MTGSYRCSLSLIHDGDAILGLTLGVSVTHDELLNKPLTGERRHAQVIPCGFYRLLIPVNGEGVDGERRVLR